MPVRVGRFYPFTCLLIVQIVTARSASNSSPRNGALFFFRRRTSRSEKSSSLFGSEAAPRYFLATARGGAESVYDAKNTTDDDGVSNNYTSQTEAVGVPSPQSSSALVFKASKPGDGSESDPDGLPRRFLIMQKGNRPAAVRAFAATQLWRAENNVDTILGRPHPQLDRCKRVVPSFFCGRDAHNNPVFVQQLGRMDLDYGRRVGVSEDDLLRHYVYVFEYCWNILEPRVHPTEGVMTSVLDLGGVGWKTVNDKKNQSFCGRMVSVMSAHYPTRSYKTFIINAPTWFNILYKIFKPLMRESTRKKISIFSGGPAQDKALKELLGEAIPIDLLCTDAEKKTAMEKTAKPETTGRNSQIEQDIRKFCLARLKKEGMEMELIDD